MCLYVITEASSTLARWYEWVLAWWLRGACSVVAPLVYGGAPLPVMAAHWLPLATYLDLGLEAGQPLVQLGHKWCCLLWLLLKMFLVLGSSLPWCELTGEWF